MINQKTTWFQWLLRTAGIVAVIYLILVGVGAILIVSDPIRQVDAVVVLSGDDGSRLALAIDLHAAGNSPNLVITSTDRTANADLRRAAKAGGFAPDRIFITEMKVNNTIDEAVAVRSLAEAQRWQSLMVVTDPFHSLRTRVIFKQILAGTGIEVLMRPVPSHWYRSTSWFFTSAGWQMTGLELSKLAAFFLGYQ